MAASQKANNAPNIQINAKQAQVQSPHSYSRSHGQIPQIMRYQSSPIAHWGNQYNANSNMNIFYQTNIKHSVNPPGHGHGHPHAHGQIVNDHKNEPEIIMQSQASQPSNNSKKKNPNNNKSSHHNRNSSASMSYIQQRQQAFFVDNNIAEPTSDSDDEIYDDMYKDGLGANNINIDGANTNHRKKARKKVKKKSKKDKGSKSRQETEDVWCCSVCTYQNNMLLGYCELCGCKKSNTPNIVKRVIFNGGQNNENDDNNSAEKLSPSPQPQQAPVDDMGLFDLANNNENNNKHQQIPADLLHIPPPHEQHNHTKTKHLNKNRPKKNRRQQLHRKIKSESNILDKVGKYWQCNICTFAENPMERPVCKMCSALPPERPPSPNPPFVMDASKGKLAQVPNGNIDNMHKIANEVHVDDDDDDDDDTDPLGHQKSASITELPIMDESVLHKQEAQKQNSVKNVNAFIDFGYNKNKNSAKMEQQQNSNTDLLGMSQLMVNNQPPSVLNSNGGVGFHNASASGQNIIRGLQPYDIPDLPAEKTDKNNKSANTIANLGVDVNEASNNNNKSANSGIGGWFGKVYNGVRKRAQSTENSDTLSPHEQGNRSRSKSPRGLRRIKEENQIGSNTSKRNISVATMPKKQQEKIAKRLNGLHTKKDLLRELDSSQQKLQKKLKQHANKVMQLKSEINVLEEAKSSELKQWNSWYVLELVEIAKEYYSHKLSSINHQIELEKLHIECFTEKLQRLDNANSNIRKHKKWTIDDVRNNIEVAFHTAWRIRLSQDVPDKQDYVKQLKQLTHNLYHTYQSKKNHLGKPEISKEERKEEVFLFLQSVLAKYESTQMISNKSFKLQKNLQNDDDFYAPYNEMDQNVFDSFILDQRTKEGRIVCRWLIFIRKKYKEITFEDLSDFMQKLAHTFLHSYSLPTKQYYECVRILCFRCIFRRRIIKKIIYQLLNNKNSQTENPEVINMKQITSLDELYQKKVMWMRALNDTQLGIVANYWLKKEIKLPPILNQKNSLNLPGAKKQSSQNGRRSSQIALLAGKDIPFAESINLMGQLEVDYHVIQKYKESCQKISDNNQNQNNQTEIKLIRKSVFSRSSSKNNNNEEKDDINTHQNVSRYDINIIPFILPQQGLHTLLLATKSIYNNAMIYYYTHYPEKKDDKNDDGAFISQDDLFPIILYCVIQSKLETPHKLIHFIEHILPKEKSTMGQSAFALSALKAAVEYISQAKPTTFGMDAEIELD